MRERLVLTLVSMTVGVLVVFGVVRAYSTADLVRDQHETTVRQEADLVSVAIDAREQDGAVTSELLDALAGSTRSITYVDATGAVLSGGTAATRDDDISTTRDVRGGGRVTVSEASSVRSDQVADALLPLALLGLALAAVAAIVGWLLARRLARPFRRLADDAVRIGDGDFDVDVQHSSIIEAEDLGNALRSAAGQLSTLVRRERELAVVASHELRTPITSLRLSLEDLTLWPHTPADVADELGRSLAEVDRLSDVVSALLDHGDRSHLGAVAEVDLAVVAAEAARRWADRAATLGRPVEAGPSGAVPTRVVRSSVERILDVLIENALVHGAGTVTVDAVRADTYTGVRVADEGLRALPAGVVHASPAGDGRDGLSEAAVQAESLGGFIGVQDVPSTQVVLALPLPD